MKLLARKMERQILDRIFSSGKPEFLAIYGRRRVGKTYLVRQFFKSKNAVFLNITGAKDVSLKEQIEHFVEQLGETFFNGITPKSGKNWNETFKILTDAIKSVPKNKKVVLFFDEFPWMATKNSKLLQNLDYYWNQHWSQDSRIKLIVCGSSASWILDKIIHNKGGLYNRVTQTIHLEPLNLYDTKRFLRQAGIKLNNSQIAQIYMVIGGIPYYLDKVEKGLTATQIIENLSFRKKSFLLEEFELLFATLFDHHDRHIDIMRIIAASQYGIGQEELLKKLGKSEMGYAGLNKLKNLEDAGFLMSFKSHFHKKKGIYYRIIDEYSHFYFRWIEPIRKTLLKTGLRKGYLDKIQISPAWKNWGGYAFESICYKHLMQIGEALNLSPTAIPNTWRYVPIRNSQKKGAQIDLLFDRDDNAITVCEIKYTEKPFAIDKTYAANLANKLEIFKKQTRTKKQIFFVMISANGLKKTIYSEEMVTGLVKLDDLFQAEE
jgi:uncharacterized protein